jgi:hypothetical protein
MAITIKTLKGTNSLSADRITINDNFKINTDAINGLLGIVNTTTGKIDNTGVGADNTITTDAITVKTSGIDVQNGAVTVQKGEIKLPKDGASIEMGTDGSKIIDVIQTFGATAPNGGHAVKFENFIAIEVPSMTNAEVLDMTGLGATGPYYIAFDTTQSKFKGWDGTAWVDFH